MGEGLSLALCIFCDCRLEQWEAGAETRELASNTCQDFLGIGASGFGGVARAVEICRRRTLGSPVIPVSSQSVFNDNRPDFV